MLGSFSVIPYISLSLVANVGVDESWACPGCSSTGGILTLIGAPLIGRLADRYGKLPVYRVVATISIGLMLVVTNLPRVPLAVAVGVVGSFMLSNAGRMVAALTMITGSVERRLRGGFMSANSAVQHLASGLGAAIGGQMLVKAGRRHAAALQSGRALRRGGDRTQPLAGRSRAARSGRLHAAVRSELRRHNPPARDVGEHSRLPGRPGRGRAGLKIP